MTALLLVFQPFLIVLAAPLTVGMVRKTKARFQNRRGASVFQPYWALLALMRKEMTITRWSTWVFRLVPFVVLAAALVLACSIPVLSAGLISHAFGNVFLIGGMLALGSVFLVMGGMDTASTFGNMGSSREMTLATLAEPALFVILASLGILAGSWSTDGIMAFIAADPWAAPAVLALAVIALTLVALLENARYPVDNPATHLELTMVHEAMVLEYSGPYLAMLEYASAIKLTVFSTLIMNIALPFFLVTGAPSPVAFGLALLAFFAKLALAAFAVALIETVSVKMRFYRMQEYATLAYLSALAVLITLLVELH